jgi:hypothetical protein
VGVASEHAAIEEAAGDFILTPLGGEVRIEGQEVRSRHRLVDGETIELGAGRFVFKSAAAD